MGAPRRGAPFRMLAGAGGVECVSESVCCGRDLWRCGYCNGGFRFAVGGGGGWAIVGESEYDLTEAIGIESKRVSDITFEFDRNTKRKNSVRGCERKSCAVCVCGVGRKTRPQLCV